MKKANFVWMVLALSAPVSAFAGYGSCRNQDHLSCQASSGQSGDEAVRDIQQEYFDPAECEASVVLYTSAGKFVATYSANEGTVRAWIDLGDKETMLLTDVALDASRSNVSTSSGSVSFQCSLSSSH